jgi:hypothetical protein
MHPRRQSLILPLQGACRPVPAGPGLPQAASSTSTGRYICPGPCGYGQGGFFMLTMCLHEEKMPLLMCIQQFYMPQCRGLRALEMGVISVSATETRYLLWRYHYAVPQLPH